MPISDAVTAGMSKTALTGAGMGLGSAALASAGGDSGQPVGERVGGRQFGVRVDQASRDREQKGQMAGIAAAAAAALMLPAGLAGLKGAASTALVPSAAGVSHSDVRMGYGSDRQRIPRSQVPPDPTSGAGQIAATPPAGLLPAPAPPSLFRPEPLLLPAPTRPTPPLPAAPPGDPQEPQPSPWQHPNLGDEAARKMPQGPQEQSSGPGPSSEDRVRVENREINPKGSKL